MRFTLVVSEKKHIYLPRNLKYNKWSITKVAHCKMSALFCVFQALSKQTDLPERAVQIWFRRRQLKDAPTPLQKFRESRYCKDNALTLSLFIYIY